MAQFALPSPLAGEGQGVRGDASETRGAAVTLPKIICPTSPMRPICLAAIW